MNDTAACTPPPTTTDVALTRTLGTPAEVSPVIRPSSTASGDPRNHPWHQFAHIGQESLGVAFRRELLVDDPGTGTVARGKLGTIRILKHSRRKRVHVVGRHAEAILSFLDEVHGGSTGVGGDKRFPIPCALG